MARGKWLGCFFGVALIGSLLADSATVSGQDPEKRATPAPRTSPGDDDSKKPGSDKKATKPAAGDDDLDKLLERIGESEPDRPRTKNDRPNPGQKPAEKPRVADPSAKKLDQADQSLDQHLEELLGRRRRRPQDEQKKQQSGQSGQSGGANDEDSPLARTIKKMREVEKRLGQRDTGESTRERQGEIVKDLDQLIAQVRRSAQQRGQRQQQSGQGQGQPGQPGNENQPGATAQGVGSGKPKLPTNVRAMVGNKDVWGNLPPALREEMENVFREEALPGRADRISRYYEAVNRKSSQAK
jgi:hypothetical protein